MKWTPWQIVALVGIVMIGAEAPMFILAASIDSDEAAKATLGTLFGGVSALVIAMVVKLTQTRKSV